ncbi:MAG: PQQ-binding-like beta-propeller repeat protein [Phycisphaera sp.]|nr:PQQ-binding-like beta-propeller repeat protein [Phycisphaera sp.]
MRSVLIGLIVALSAGGASAQNWPNWRGPNYDGSSGAKGLPTQFSKTDNVKWSVDLPGPSAATPIVWGDRVFVSSTDPATEKLIALCFDRKTGKQLWRDEPAKGYQKERSRSNYASPSPVTDGEIVVFTYGTGDVVAYNVDGSKLWSRNLQADYGKFNNLWTPSSSPVLVDGLLVFEVLQRDMPIDLSKPIDPVKTDTRVDSYVLALTASTGKEVWRVVRPTDAVIEAREAYTTPLPVATKDGGVQIVVTGGDCVTSHDLRTGKELWRWGTWNPRRIPHYRQVPSATVGGGVVLVCGPKKEPVYAIKLGGSGTLDDTSIAWNSSEERVVTTDVPTPLFYNGSFYVLSDMTKRLSRVDPASGAVAWTIEMPGHYKWRTSPTGADGKVWLMNHHGDVVIVDAAKGEIVNTIPMGADDDDNIRSGLAVVDGELFVRVNRKLYCVGK